jgi:hypothetical protein
MAATKSIEVRIGFPSEKEAIAESLSHAGQEGREKHPGGDGGFEH